MEWENKVKMCQLGNQRHSSDEAKKEFQSFVLENIKAFDIQAWGMFCELSDLIVEEMRVDIEYWKEVFKYTNTINKYAQLGFRTGMRIAMIQTICEEELLLKK